MERVVARTQRVLWIVAAMTVVMYLFAILLGLAVLKLSRDADANAQQARLQLCVELEKLKTQNRAEAEHDFKQLNRTLKLLHLARTPEIVQAAEEQRDRRLALNKRKEC